MSLLLLLNPKQYGGAVAEKDTSDILDVYRRKKRKYDQLEEAIAAQLLRARQTDLTIPKEVDEDKLASILRSKMRSAPQPGELAGKERIKRIRVLLLLLAMDD